MNFCAKQRFLHLSNYNHLIKWKILSLTSASFIKAIDRITDIIPGYKQRTARGKIIRYPEVLG